VGEVIVWALATAAISAGVWFEIVLIEKHRRLVRFQERLVGELSERLDQLDAMEKRLAETEGRLEFAERLLASGGAPPPAGLARPVEPPPDD